MDCTLANDVLTNRPTVPIPHVCPVWLSELVDGDFKLMDAFSRGVYNLGSSYQSQQTERTKRPKYEVVDRSAFLKALKLNNGRVFCGQSARLKSGDLKTLIKQGGLRISTVHNTVAQSGLSTAQCDDSPDHREHAPGVVNAELYRKSVNVNIMELTKRKRLKPGKLASETSKCDSSKHSTLTLQRSPILEMISKENENAREVSRNKSITGDEDDSKPFPTTRSTVKKSAAKTVRNTKQSRYHGRYELKSRLRKNKQEFGLNSEAKIIVGFANVSRDVVKRQSHQSSTRESDPLQSCSSSEFDAVEKAPSSCSITPTTERAPSACSRTSTSTPSRTSTRSTTPSATTTITSGESDNSPINQPKPLGIAASKRRRIVSQSESTESENETKPSKANMLFTSSSDVNLNRDDEGAWVSDCRYEEMQTVDSAKLESFTAQKQTRKPKKLSSKRVHERPRSKYTSRVEILTIDPEPESDDALSASGQQEDGNKDPVVKDVQNANKNKADVPQTHLSSGGLLNSLSVVISEPAIPLREGQTSVESPSKLRLKKPVVVLERLDFSKLPYKICTSAAIGSKRDTSEQLVVDKRVDSDDKMELAKSKPDPKLKKTLKRPKSVLVDEHTSSERTGEKLSEGRIEQSKVGDKEMVKPRGQMAGHDNRSKVGISDAKLPEGNVQVNMTKCDRKGKDKSPTSTVLKEKEKPVLGGKCNVEGQTIHKLDLGKRLDANAEKIDLIKRVDANTEKNVEMKTVKQKLKLKKPASEQSKDKVISAKKSCSLLENTAVAEKCGHKNKESRNLFTYLEEPAQKKLHTVIDKSPMNMKRDKNDKRKAQTQHGPATGADQKKVDTPTDIKLPAKNKSKPGSVASKDQHLTVTESNKKLCTPTVSKQPLENSNKTQNLEKKKRPVSVESTSKKLCSASAKTSSEDIAPTKNATDRVMESSASRLGVGQLPTCATTNSESNVINAASANLQSRLLALLDNFDNEGEHCSFKPCMSVSEKEQEAWTNALMALNTSAEDEPSSQLGLLDAEMPELQEEVLLSVMRSVRTKLKDLGVTFDDILRDVDVDDAWEKACENPKLSLKIERIDGSVTFKRFTSTGDDLS